jgi:hypothetical protein
VWFLKSPERMLSFAIDFLPSWPGETCASTRVSKVWDQTPSDFHLMVGPSSKKVISSSRALHFSHQQDTVTRILSVSRCCCFAWDKAQAFCCRSPSVTAQMGQGSLASTCRELSIRGSPDQVNTIISQSPLIGISLLLLHKRSIPVPCQHP